jgi:hypothetical protein
MHDNLLPSNFQGNPLTQDNNRSTTAPQASIPMPMVQQIIPQHLEGNPAINTTWGASMDIPNPKATRIYFQNINRLQFVSPTNWWEPHLAVMKDRGISIPGFVQKPIQIGIITTYKPICRIKLAVYFQTLSRHYLAMTINHPPDWHTNQVGVLNIVPHIVHI